MEASLTATQNFIQTHRSRPVSELALALSKRSDIDAAFALRQIEGWQRLSKKVPTWAEVETLLYPPRLSLEQCSGEAAARYKREVVEKLIGHGHTMADLTGGLGVDFSFVAPLFRRAIYVERQEELCRLARHNFPLLGIGHAEIVNADGTEFLQTLPEADLLFLDPARRDTAGRKTVMLEDCEPDVGALLPALLEKSRFVLLKLSPMLDLHSAIRQLGCVCEAHIVAEGGECKDLLLILSKAPQAITIHCVNDGQAFAFTPEEEETAAPPLASSVKKFLFEPNAAILKGGAFKSIATRFGLEKLHPNSHLYTADHLPDNFPGRVFEVEGATGFGKKELRCFCQGTRCANLTVRNFPASVAELRQRLKLKEGGQAYWFATTLADGSHALIATHKAEK